MGANVATEPADRKWKGVSETGQPETPPAIIYSTTTPCRGSTQNFSVSTLPGATSYTWTIPSGWTGSSTTTSINTSAISTSGNITVTANNSCGSSAIQSLTISGSNVPSAPTNIIGNATVCLNSANTYSVNAVSGAISYIWTLPSGWTGTSTTASINTIASTTSGNVTVTANNSCGSSAIQSLAITGSNGPSSPSSIIGNSSICLNSANTYSVSPVSGATSYTWSLPSGWVGVSTTTSINAVANNTSGSITVTANNSCGSSAIQSLSTTVINVIAQPVNIIGSATVCAKSSNFYFIASEPSATSYSWILPAGWKGNSTSNVITALADTSSGTLSVSINNTCGASLPQSLALKTNQVNKTVSQSGATLTANAVGAAYQWVDCKTKSLISGQTNQSFTATINGDYAVIVKQNNCVDTSACIALLTVATNELIEEDKIRFYPNPTFGLVNIELQAAMNAEFEIFNVLGERLSNGILNSMKTTLELKNKIKGIYFIKIYTAKSKITKKLLLE